MKMTDIIKKVSELYRSELAYRKGLQDEYGAVVAKLLTADHDGGKNITYDEYQRLKAKKIALKQLMDGTDKYLEGVSDVREILMEFGFGTEVE